MVKSLKRLVIDTATPYLYVAMFDENKPLFEIYKQGQNDHSVTLMKYMHKTMQENKLNPQSIDEIIVGIGPGSYTGVRIGVTVAKMLGWTLKRPVYQVSSLAVLASGGQEGTFTAWIDARREHAFYGVFRIQEDKLIRLEEDRYGVQQFAGRAITNTKPNPARLFDSELIKYVEDIHTLAPVYLRKTEAERSLEQSGKDKKDA